MILHKLLRKIFPVSRNWGDEEGASWKTAYTIMPKVIKDKDLKTGVELGVAWGGHIEAILSTTSIEKMYGVDPYRHYLLYENQMDADNKTFEKMYQDMMRRLSPFGNRYTHIRKRSFEAVSDVPEVDFVYIDSDHSYEGVKKDIALWFHKANKIISGHDYGHPDFPGVKKAVDEVFNPLGWKINSHESGVWWVEKS